MTTIANGRELLHHPRTIATFVIENGGAYTHTVTFGITEFGSVPHGDKPWWVTEKRTQNSKPDTTYHGSAADALRKVMFKCGLDVCCRPGQEAEPF